MPVMDGLETTLYIRKNFPGDLAKIPIVALTATLSQFDEMKYKSAGMNVAISKPFTEKSFFATLVNMLKTESQVKPQPETIELEEPIENIEPVNIEKLNKLANNDENFVKEMITMFLKTTQQGMLEIHQNLNENNWEEVANQSHKIISPCKHIGADKLSAYLKTIEDIARNGNNKDILTDIFADALEESDKIFQYIKKHMD